MPYSPTTWVNNTTPVDATNMNKIEAGIAAAIPKDLADAKGDLLVASAADTVARLAVGTAGQILTAGASSAISWATPAPSVGYGTTASWPGSPTDGQEFILVDSTSAPSYMWRFRYNAGGGTNKWEFIGGSPKVFSYNAGGAAMNNVAFTTASGWTWWVNSLGSVFPVPRSGDYLCRCKLDGAAGAGSVWINTALVDATPGLAVYGQAGFSSPGAGSGVALFTGALVPSLVAGTHSVGMVWTASDMGASSIQDVYIEITPVRVS